MAVDASGHEYNEDNLSAQEQDVVQECSVGALPRARLAQSHPLGLRLRIRRESASVDVYVSEEAMNTSTISVGHGTKRVRYVMTGYAMARTADPNSEVSQYDRNREDGDGHGTLPHCDAEVQVKHLR